MTDQRRSVSESPAPSTALPEAVLFDHDGTLVDTEPVWARAKEEVAAEFDAVWTEQDTLACLGQPMSMTVDRLRELGVRLTPEEIVRRLVATGQQVVAQEGIGFLPGIEPLLREVADAGIPAAIVTNATTEIARVTASRAPEGLFRTVIGDEDVQRPKPDPQPYLLAAERLGVDITRCVVVEDSPSGVAAAEAAGARVVVVPGMQPVPDGAGDARVRHEELTLAALRGVFA